MNKLMKTSLLAASIAATVAPAAAQYQRDGRAYNDGMIAEQSVNGQYGYTDFSQRIAQLQTRIQTGVQTGTISRSEARSLRQQLRTVAQLERQYAVNGVTAQERQVLQQRVRAVRQELRIAEGRQLGADGRYDDNYAGGSYGNSGRADRDNDGYDDRDYNRDGRFDDRDEDVYQEPVRRGGLGGLIDSVLGGGIGANAGLRVGTRDPGNLGGVGYNDRDRYRDDNNSYYRSDGRYIYQMDARNRTVVRTYPVTR